MNDNFCEVRFEVTGSVATRPISLPGKCIHLSAVSVDIVEAKVDQWRGKYKILTRLPSSTDNQRAADISEEIRSRFVALIAVAGRVGANGSDELLVESDRGSITLVRRGDMRELTMLATPIRLAFDLLKLRDRSDLEWNALTRLQFAFHPNSFSGKFEAFVGTVDVLARNDPPPLYRTQG